MTQETNDFINSIEGELTPEQVAELMSLGEGDTSEELDDDGLPVVIPAEDSDEAGDDKSKEGDGNADDAKKAGSESEDPTKSAILAKDGVHLIPYEKLEQARTGEQHWKAQHEASQRELAELRQQAQARADAGEAPTKTDNQAAIAQTAIDQGVDPDIFGDFSEESLAKGIKQLIEQQVSARLTPIEQQLAPLQQQQAQDATKSHYTRIHEAHPDAPSIYESTQFADWIESQPSFARDAYTNLMETGTAEQIIEMFDSFKKSTGVATPTAGKDVRAAAQAAIAKTSPPIPASLSDVPGGRAGAASRDEAMADMGALELMDAMENMSPEQVDRYLNNL